MSLQFKRSSSGGELPTIDQLEEGEIAINLTDKRIYTRDGSDNIVNIGFSESEASDLYVLQTGGIVTGELSYDRDLPLTNEFNLVPRKYVDAKFGTSGAQVRTNDQSDALYLSNTNPTVTGNISISGTPSSGNHVVDVDYVSRYLVRTTSGTINGTLSVNTPTAAAHATRKDYVDNAISSLNAIRANGGNQSINGRLGVSYPQASTDAATKSYVDNRIAGISFPDLTGYATESWVSAAITLNVTTNATNLGTSGDFIELGTTDWKRYRNANLHGRETWSNYTVDYRNGRYTQTAGSRTAMDITTTKSNIYDLHAPDAATFGNTIVVTGKITGNAGLTINGGNFDMNGSLDVSGNTTLRAIGGTALTLSSSLTVNGNSTLSTSNGTASVPGTLTVGNKIEIGDTCNLQIGDGDHDSGYFRWGNNTTTNHFGNFNVVKHPSNNFSGNIYADQDVVGYLGTRSDERLKEDIVLISSPLEKVCQLRGVTYTLKETGEKRTGLIAQEVEKVLPEAVFEAKNAFLGEDAKHVYYGETVGLLVEAIKELKAEVDDLKRQLGK